MKDKCDKHQYRFWRWLILSIVSIPRLYVLAWGVLLVCALAVFKSGFFSFVGGLLQ